MEDSKEQETSRVPATDEQGIRKVFTTPDIYLSKQGKTKYPWATINVGQSFEILHNDMKKSSLGPFVSRMAKKYGKKFKVTDMPNYHCWLVSCLPMSQAEAVATSTNIVDVLHKTGEVKPQQWPIPKGHIPGDI